MSNQPLKKLATLIAAWGFLQNALFAEAILPANLNTVPVLIQVTTANAGIFSCGTGILLWESNRQYLVTAAHCVYDVENGRPNDLIGTNALIACFAANETNGEFLNIFKFDFTVLNSLHKIARHPTHDVAAVWMGFALPGDQLPDRRWQFHGIDLLTPPTHQVTFNLPNVTCHFSEIADASEVYVLGYPVELFNEKLPKEIVFDHPLIRKGIISQKNPVTKKLIIDSGVYGGNSGGPIMVVSHPTLDVTRFKIAGIITQFVPYSTRIAPQVDATNSVFVNSGYGVAESMDTIWEVVHTWATEPNPPIPGEPPLASNKN